MPLTLEAAVALLDLPTPDAVADLLRGEGVTGEPNNCETCPIAVYLSKLTGRTILVSIHDAWPAVSIASDAVSLPAAARACIASIDGTLDSYSDLVRTP